jgi:sugar lactone lactonase YvrE
MACTQLFGLTAAAGGHAPTDTRKAALMIALHPGSQVSALYQLARTSAGLFMPDLGNVMPNDWTVAINFTGAALERSSTAALAIDAEGDVWVSSAQCDPTVTNPRGCVIELSPQGSQSGPFPTLGEAVTPDLAINGGGALAIGTNPNTGQELVWLASIAPSALYAMDARGGQFLFHGALTLGGTLRDPESLQVDLLGNVWAANSNPRFLIDGSSMGSVIEASPGTANDYTQFTEFDVVSPVGAPPPSFTDLVLDGDEPASIFVSDAFGGRIVQFDGGHPGVQVNPPVFASPDQNAPGPVAIDASGNVWAANTPSSHNPAGALELLKGVGVPGYVERDVGGNTILSPGEPGGIAEDGAGNTWVTNTDAAGNKGIVELDPSGASLTALTGLGAYNGASPPSGGPLGFPNVAASPRGLAIDSSGNVWVATGDGGGVVELVGAATPVRTPLNTRAMLP